ncbi:hypothetical protein SDC9_71965 [bioreactor metagenome]|uniref:Uncharacterized protein n=1 Tax=bioreactor metagenome TaxID=1076179 RepID=A0A644YC42_9ZZZZ
MNSQNFEEQNDAWASELQFYAPLTMENAPEGFVERVMARICEIDNLTVVTQPQPQAPVARRSGGRIRRIFPIAATAAAVLLLFAMPALRRGDLTEIPLPETAAPSALESSEAPKMTVRQESGATADGDSSNTAEDPVTSFGTDSIVGTAPGEKALPQESPVEGEAADNGLPTPFKSALSRGCGGFIDEDGSGDYCLLYGATGRPAGIAFCVILEGGTPPEDVLPVVPGQYLITPEQLEALLLVQPEDVEPEYIEEGLTASATVGLVIIKQLPPDN